MNTDNFKSFRYKVKLLGDKVTDVANRGLENAAMAMPLRYLSNFWISLEMALINCKVQLKLNE